MKAIKVMATIDEHGQLTLDHPLMTDKNSRVEVIVLIAELVGFVLEPIWSIPYVVVLQRHRIISYQGSEGIIF